MNHLYKIGRTKGKGQHLEQWEKKCHYKAELIKISPDGKNLGISLDEVLDAYPENSEPIQELKTQCFTSPIGIICS
ncbi:14562_t:CDS:2 [Entrophospora sp. SA101]|nr:14562_t:CDS:2 [Entrophospora sp. SA101]